MKSTHNPTLAVSILEHWAQLLKLLKYVTCKNMSQKSGTRALYISPAAKRKE